MPLTVTTDLTIITTAEATAGWSSIGAGGAGPALEPDFFVQGSNCISRAVSGSGTEKGCIYDYGSAIDFTSGVHKDKLVYMWVRVNTPQLVDTLIQNGVQIRLAGPAITDYDSWMVDGSDTIPALDGWICYAINPRGAAIGSSGGAYNPATVRYFGASIKTTTTAKGQNIGVDQIAIGRGEIYVGGTNTVAGRGFGEIWDRVYGTSTSTRYGLLTSKGGNYLCKGKIIIGMDGYNTDFSSQGESVVWSTTPSQTNIGGIVGDTVGDAVPNVSFGGTLGADGYATYYGLAFRGFDGYTTKITLGTAAGVEDGRSGVKLVGTGPSASLSVNNKPVDLNIYDSQISNFGYIVDLDGYYTDGYELFATTFTSNNTIRTNMKVRKCNFISNSNLISQGAFRPYDGMDIADSLFANNNYGITFSNSTGTPFDLDNIAFSSNTFDVRNATGSAITLNILGGTTPTVSNTTNSTTTLVINPVVTTITVIDGSTLSPVSGARVLVTASDNTGPMPYQKTTTITRTGSDGYATCTGHGLVTGKQVLIKGADQQEYNGIFTVNVTGTNTYTFTVAGAPTTPATGTITSTGVVINGDTDGSGIITDTRSHTASQNITGRVRKSTSGTLYKTSILTGTISNTTGFSTTVVLIRDQ